MFQYLFVILLFIFLGTALYGGVKGAPWVPTRKEDISRFLKLANIKPEDVVYDLGSGDGSLVMAAAKRGARAFGFEISLFPYLISKIKQLIIGLPNLSIRYKDFFSQDLSLADLVYVFLMPKCYRRLKEKLETQLKPGARVITYVWPVPGWRPVKVDKPTPRSITLYLYQMA